jgi:hypothetical protein
VELAEVGSFPTAYQQPQLVAAVLAPVALSNAGAFGDSRNLSKPGRAAGPMTTGQVIELSSLVTRHPAIGAALLHSCGPSVIVRLGIDPAELSSGTMTRSVEVDWLERHRGTAVAQVSRAIGCAWLNRYAVVVRRAGTVLHAEPAARVSGLSRSRNERNQPCPQRSLSKKPRPT